MGNPRRTRERLRHGADLAVPGNGESRDAAARIIGGDESPAGKKEVARVRAVHFRTGDGNAAEELNTIPPDLIGADRLPTVAVLVDGIGDAAAGIRDDKGRIAAWGNA